MTEVHLKKLYLAYFCGNTTSALELDLTTDGPTNGSHVEPTTASILFSPDKFENNICNQSEPMSLSSSSSLAEVLKLC